LGMPADRVLVCLDGDSVVLTDGGMTRGEPVPSDEVYVDGRVGGVDRDVLRQRRRLGSGGFVAVVAEVERAARRIVGRPAVLSRGWATDDDQAELHEAVAAAVTEALSRALADPETDLDSLERVVRRAAGSTVNERTHRR